MLTNLSGASLIFEPYSDKYDSLSIACNIYNDFIVITEFELLEVFCESLCISNVIFNTVYIEPNDHRFLRLILKTESYRVIFVIDNVELKYWESNFSFKSYDNIEVHCFDIYGSLLSNENERFNLSTS